MSINLTWLATPLLLIFVHLAEAQQPKKVPKIGYLSGTDLGTDSPRAKGILLALREIGYIEGQNIAIEYRHASGKGDRVPELVADLVRLKVHLIVVGGGDNAIRGAMNATKTTPIILTGPGSDPVEAGFVESLGRPGGNITGLTLLSRELGGKRLELLKETIPKLTSVAVLYDPVPGTTREVKEDLPVAALGLRLSVQPWEVRSADGLEAAFVALNKERPGGVYVPGGGSFMRANLGRIAGFSLKSRLPSLYSYREALDAGGLIYYGADEIDGYRRVASYVDRILKGAKPAELPVEQPTKFEFFINLKTAKQIGLTIPPNVLARADRVIR